jgi:hypothetical protein
MYKLELSCSTSTHFTTAAAPHFTGRTHTPSRHKETRKETRENRRLTTFAVRLLARTPAETKDSGSKVRRKATAQGGSSNLRCFSFQLAEDSCCIRIRDPPARRIDSGPVDWTRLKVTTLGLIRSKSRYVFSSADDPTGCTRLSSSSRRFGWQKLGALPSTSKQVIRI